MGVYKGTMILVWNEDILTHFKQHVLMLEYILTREACQIHVC